MNLLLLHFYIILILIVLYIPFKMIARYFSKKIEKGEIEADVSEILDISLNEILFTWGGFPDFPYLICLIPILNIVCFMGLLVISVFLIVVAIGMIIREKLKKLKCMKKSLKEMFKNEIRKKN